MFKSLETSLLVVTLAFIQVCLCDQVAGTDNPLITREQISELSSLVYLLKTETVERKCGHYASSLENMIGDKLPESATEVELFNAIIGVLKDRKLPFGNSQPVLKDLQRCVEHRDAFGSDQQLNSRREVIAGPPRKEEPSPKQGEQMEKILQEHEDVRQRTKDHGQDIYYKPNHQKENYDERRQPNHAPYQDDLSTYKPKVEPQTSKLGPTNGNTGKNIPYDQGNFDKVPFQRGERIYDKPQHPIDGELFETLAREKAELRNRLDSRESELNSLKDELAGLKEVIKANNRANPSGESELARARFENMKQLYEAAIQREENMRRLVEESSRRGNKEEEKDDKKRIKDPADQAAILYDKLNAKDKPENRCYKYYLLFSYPDKIKKNTVKTIAKLQVDLHDMDEFYSIVDQDLLNKFDRIMKELASSKKKDILRAAEEFRQCLRGVGQQKQHNDIPNEFEIPVTFNPPRNGGLGSNNREQKNTGLGRFEIPVNYAPGRGKNYAEFNDDDNNDSYGQYNPYTKNSRGPYVTTATASVGDPFGGSNFGGFFNPMAQFGGHSGRNPYIH